MKSKFGSYVVGAATFNIKIADVESNKRQELWQSTFDRVQKS